MMLTRQLFISTRSSPYPYYLIILFLALNLPLLTDSLQSNAFTFHFLLANNILLSVLGVGTYSSARIYPGSIDIKRSIPVFVQGTLQLSIFLYVILMYPDAWVKDLVASRIPLIFYQIIFAFVFDYLFKVYRGEVYYPGFYLIPMVFSFNLILWFLDDYFIIHLFLIILGILIKNFVVRTNQDGITKHIFNPSYILLTLCAIGIFFFFDHVRSHLYDAEIFNTYDRTPGFDLYIFLVGCIVLWLPNSYLIAFGAYSTVMLLNAITQYFFGYILFYGLLRGDVLIAVMLGITDPATTPRTQGGKFLFGVAYGVMLTLIGFIFVLAKLMYVAVYFKILALPPLNYFASKFDNVIKFQLFEGYYLTRFASIFIFVLVFYLTYAELESSSVHRYFLMAVSQRIWAALGIN